MADTPNTPGNARMTWDHAADHCLLMCMAEVLNPTQENLRVVTDKMHAIGYTCTTKAISQHLQKLRRKEHSAGANDDGGDGAGTTAATAAPKTPRGRKTKAAGTNSIPKTPGTNKRKGGAAAVINFPEEDDSDTYSGKAATPAPHKGRRNKRVKKEDSEAAEEDLKEVVKKEESDAEVEADGDDKEDVAAGIEYRGENTFGFA